MKKHCFGLLLSVFIPSAYADYSYQLLRDTRPNVTLPEYSPEQRALVFEQTNMLLEQIFVHEALKIRHFGQDANFRPLMAALKPRIASMPIADFHVGLAKVFRHVRDLHSWYNFPKPYSCYRSLLPISFEWVKEDGVSKVRVSQVTETKEVLALYPELTLAVGDELLTYDGQAVWEAVEDRIELGRGANPMARRRRAVSALASLTQRYNLFPEHDELQLTLRNSSNVTYTVSLPWATELDKDCVPKPSTLPTIQTRPRKQLPTGTFDEQEDLNRIFVTRASKSPKGKDEWIATDEPILKYKTIANQNGSFGVIRLDSFTPSKLSVDDTIVAVRDLLRGPLAGTDGIIFDLRNNGGGYIALAEGLVQLFTAQEVRPLDFLLKNSEATWHLWKGSPTNPFAQALTQARIEGAAYTTTRPINPGTRLNTLGQFQFRPVAVFTNARCYSSCDMFSAQMQDQTTALIVGEDDTTGAGGANNTNLNDLLKNLPPTQLGPFAKLPFEQNVGFAYRQSYRVTDLRPKVLEDYGVRSTMIVPPTLRDLKQKSAAQYLEIGRVLKLRGRAVIPWARLDEVKRVDLRLGEAPAVKLQWGNIDTFTFLSPDGKSADVAVANDGRAGSVLPFPSIFDLPEAGQSSFTLLGKLKGKTVYRGQYAYRMVPAPTVVEDAGLDLLLENSTLALYTNQKSGWSLKNEVLRIGDGANYPDLLSAQASLFARLPSRALQLTMEMELGSEEKYDFFKITVLSEGKETLVQAGLSGTLAKQTYTYDLSAFAGKDVELRVAFDSDENTNGAGVRITTLALTAK